MNSEDVADVIVVGAGPVGSMAALLADRLGLSVVLVDASTEVYPKPRAIHFDADIMRIFQFAGLADELEPRVRATSGALHLGEDGEPIRDFRVVATEGDLGWKPHYMFYQPEVDRMLRRRAEDAPGIHTAFGWSCRSIAELDDHVVVELGNESGEVRIERARYVIAADGSTSTIRKSLGIELTDYGFDEPWIVIDADADSDELGPDYSIMYCDPQRPATYVPGPRAHRRWEFMVLPGEDSSTLAEPEVALSLIRQVTPWYDDGRLTISRAAVYRFHALVADRWRQGRILLAGDAAHQTPPFYGQGMCHGMRDVRNLAWKLRAVLRDGVPDELLDSYQVEREPHVRAIIEQSVANGRYICVLDVDEAKVRDARMRELMENPAPQAPKTWKDLIPGLSTGVLDETGSSPATGLLFPQPWVTASDGRHGRLDDIVGDGWVLITTAPYADREASGPPAFVVGADVIDDSGTLQAWLSAFDAESVLLRPDRYVFGVANDAEGTRALLDAREAALHGLMATRAE
ncbi:bifunctional 3-(3-hydroxy-phenyl)propionate/3-hydroxycinnamic acid hydroxylase MhpA [Humibacter ginsenosidimutans]|uniref:Bifunctional 3-(3-hydroxy-phenyl)propionate/3-hydroxycinnamic acid hydroxylase n=1 Tax=Humibacter ginsenosidimutans TaxID=2599293 RepID=A0A5B8M832_9MICO|nr:bifunctional 3-(3-hydroxy-phenyl)propionate/3-hydroxycinnamic acid hydroxylase [Humibacter ginsenosidimutans]QDZ15825.1 bifunctional 3-(3-hydroxy-phenyl)propionate/3-hydroxycinnamic acid hydroxylase [Humibacter ginsenosidimutans]